MTNKILKALCLLGILLLLPQWTPVDISPSRFIFTFIFIYSCIFYLDLQFRFTIYIMILYLLFKLSTHLPGWRCLCVYCQASLPLPHPFPNPSIPPVPQSPRAAAALNKEASDRLPPASPVPSPPGSRPRTVILRPRFGVSGVTSPF